MNNFPEIAYIGTGSMGKPMIFKLLKLGYSVRVYDKYPEAAETVIQAGAIWCDSPKEVAKNADIVITNLPLPRHVTENMLGENGALAGMKTGSIWIDFSTTDYHNTEHIANEAKKKGVSSLESPVSNLSHMGVDFGNVSFYVNGDQESFNICKKALNDMGKVSFFVSDKTGEAQTVKLLTNLLCYTAIVVLGEVLVIAKMKGIPLDWMWDFIKASPGISFASEQLTPFILDGSYDYSCALEIAVKDISLTVELAEELNIPLLLGRIIQQRYNQAGDKYQLTDNYLIVAKLVEEENSLELRIPSFVAPSPYGIDRSYIHYAELVTDSFGRVKPKPYQLNYERPQQILETHLEELAQDLTDLMAYIDYLILQEADMLGKNMGLNKDVLVKVIRWSCGASWISDHEDSYKPNNAILTKIQGYNIEQQVKIPIIEKVISMYQSRANT